MCGQLSEGPASQGPKGQAPPSGSVWSNTGDRSSRKKTLLRMRPTNQQSVSAPQGAWRGGALFAQLEVPPEARAKEPAKELPCSTPIPFCHYFDIAEDNLFG